MKPILINIVLLGPGKVGSQLINLILNKQFTMLTSKNIDVRIALVESNSLIFVENSTFKNSWDVSFLKSKHVERVNSLIRFINHNGYQNVIIIDCTKNQELPESYPLFIQNGFHVISLNSQTQYINPKKEDEISISAEIYGKSYQKINDFKQPVETSCLWALEAILTNCQQNTLIEFRENVI